MLWVSYEVSLPVETRRRQRAVAMEEWGTLPPHLHWTQWDGRQNLHITLYTDGNKYGGMEGRTEYRLFASGDLCIFH